jgi:hypothetical protein
MQEGGSAEARIIAEGLYALMSDGTNEEVVAYINKNRSDLVEIAKIDDPMFDMLRKVLSQFPVQSDLQGAPMEEELLGNLGRREALRAAGDTRLSDQDLGTIGQAMGEVEDIRELAGTQPYLYGPSPPSEQFDDSPRTMAPFRPAEQINAAGSDIERPRRGNPTAGYRDIFGPTGITPSGGDVRDFGWETAADILADDIRFSGQRKEPTPWDWRRVKDPEGMAHGGVPRGTVAGELEPRGYLTARQAGETMRERAKGLRGRRNYGGGIGSLYNRYG